MLKDRLFQKRTELKLSREALAEKVGVSTSTITFLENGRNESSKHLVEIASALGVTAEWLKDGGEVVLIPSNHKDGETVSDEMMYMDAWDDNTPMHPYEVALPFFKDVQLSAGFGCFELDDYSGRTLRSSKGHRKNKHHQYLTDDHGVPELREHLSKVMVLMDASSNNREFNRLLNKSLPKYGATLEIDLQQDDT